MPTVAVTQITVRKLGEDDPPALEDMYRTFDATRPTLGVPPVDPERRHSWLLSLKEGVNFVAFAGGTMAGHLALMVSGRSAEMAVFVHQDYRRHGMASALADRAVQEARAMGLRYLWVLISSDNHPARTGLLKYGFHTAWESLGEVQMVFRL